MPSIKTSVIHVHTSRTKLLKIPIKVLAVGLFILLGAINLPTPASAASCPDVKIIYVRGSGAPVNNNAGYQTFKSALESKLKTSNLNYEFTDLNYPAVGVGLDNLDVTLGAYIGGGEAYAFGDSVKQGIKNLTREVNSSTCPNTKYVVAGYSQGAMVVSGGLEKLNPSKLIYAATFGDPKIYLPEGAGAIPPACRGTNLSSYRIYVPDCRAYKGLLGAKNPYTTTAYQGKIGTWCNKRDIFCSSHFSITSHTSYEKDGLYEDASRLIFSKIAAAYNFKNQYTSPHDTAILIDSTGSMGGLINNYKAEALRLAEKTLSSGGRVALYDYRDLTDPYTPVEHCNFESCTLESFQAGLDEITIDGGGDDNESLLSASLHVMKSLKWKLGSTKSLVILTDAGYHSPDHDGTTFYDVKKLSKEIDPVNFYIITKEENLDSYQELATATDGAVASTVDDLSLLTDTIIERYDSLSRVEEEFGDNSNFSLPHLEITSVEKNSDSEHRISFKSTGTKTLVILNDSILGVTDQADLTISGLRNDQENTLTLVPLANDYRGDPVIVALDSGHGQVTSPTDSPTTPDTPQLIPKAPNTGRRQSRGLATT